MYTRRRRTTKKPKATRRRRTVRRIPRAVAPTYRGITQWTPYKYKMTLLHNILGTTAAGGNVEFKPNPPNSFEVGSAPFIPGQAQFSPIFPSGTGLANYIDFGMACAFRISDLVNALPFQNSYDAYRIDKVTCNLQYLSNSAQVNGGGIFPTFYVYNDPDDSVTPTSLQQIAAKQGCRKFFPGNGARTVFTQHIAPRVNEVVQGVNVNTLGLAVGRKHKWIDNAGQANGGVPHNSLKIWVTDWDAAAPPAVANILKFQFTYHMSFRGPLIAN